MDISAAMIHIAPASPLTSASLLHQAARNLYLLEWMHGKDVWRSLVSNEDWYLSFWQVQRMLALTPVEQLAWLPALAVAVQQEKDPHILNELVRWPAPDNVPLEAKPWCHHLAMAWEACRIIPKNICLAPRIHLDRRISRLPEWLAEARQLCVNGFAVPYYAIHWLAVLAQWRPLPNECTQADGCAHLQDWFHFWNGVYRQSDDSSFSARPIAAQALLNLAGGSQPPHDICPEQLLESIARQVGKWHDFVLLAPPVQDLLLSPPIPAVSPEKLRLVVAQWLKLTMPENAKGKRQLAWAVLAAWQRKGTLEHGEADSEQLRNRGQLQELSLLTDLARTLEWEEDDGVLWAMAGYIPGAVEVSAHPEAARAVVARWEALSREAFFWGVRQAAWVARWNLLRAGVLTAGEQARFAADYVDAVRSEKRGEVLLALAQMSSPGPFPLAGWLQRLKDWDAWRRLAAGLATQRYLLDMMDEVSNEQRVVSSELPLATRHSPPATLRRQVRQALRRLGQEGTDAGTVIPFVNLPPEVLPDFRRLREIETALAAGCLPPPPDAAAENRATPRTVPARLPEAHPRTDPPGITDRTTGRTAGSDPQARHPFPEVIRHE